MAAALELDIAGRTIRLTHPDKVLYPATGTTKQDVVAYFVTVAPALLCHVAGKPVTLARFPDGVGAPWWFQSNCPPGKPAWLPVAAVRGTRGQPLRYCILDEPAALAWAANTGALEIHPFLASAERPESPLALVFDLDPSAPASLGDACRVALRIRELLGAAGMSAVAKTSGRTGIHVVVPLDGSQGFDATKGFARLVAGRLAAATPSLVSAALPRAHRAGKVLVDWRQNAPGLQTVAPYSLRGTAVPRVSAPVTWEEVAAAAEGRTALSFGPREVLERLSRRGDLFVGPAQRLPSDAATAVPP